MYLHGCDTESVGHFARECQCVLIHFGLRLWNGKICLTRRCLDAFPSNLTFFIPHEPSAVHFRVEFLRLVTSDFQSLRIKENMVTGMFANHHRGIGKLGIKEFLVRLAIWEIGLDVEISNEPGS